MRICGSPVKNQDTIVHQSDVIVAQLRQWTLDQSHCYNVPPYCSMRHDDVTQADNEAYIFVEDYHGQCTFMPYFLSNGYKHHDTILLCDVTLLCLAICHYFIIK